jgi:hypothetical protein
LHAFDDSLVVDDNYRVTNSMSMLDYLTVQASTYIKYLVDNTSNMSTYASDRIFQQTANFERCDPEARGLIDIIRQRLPWSYILFVILQISTTQRLLRLCIAQGSHHETKAIKYLKKRDQHMTDC